jgi:hypothetical protein
MEADLMSTGYLYVIKDNQTSLTKIGITGNWQSRLRTLKVGKKTECKIVVEVNDNREWEKRLHRKYDPWRLVGTEWFKLDASTTNELIERVKKIGPPVSIDGEQIEQTSYSENENWWATPQGQREASMLIHNIDEDEITDLKILNPWVDRIVFSQEHEWEHETASVWFSFWHPKSLGGKLSDVFVDPDGTIDGSYFDYEDEGDKWMVKSFEKPPGGMEDVIDRLWTLKELPKTEWPLRVLTNWEKIKKEKAEAEAKAGPKLPKNRKKREQYLKKVVDEYNQETAKAFCLARMRTMIFCEWKQKGLDTEPDHPVFVYNAKIHAEAELRYANGFRVYESKWHKVGDDGKWIECEEHETSF